MVGEQRENFNSLYKGVNMAIMELCQDSPYQDREFKTLYQSLFRLFVCSFSNLHLRHYQSDVSFPERFPSII